MNFLRIEMKKLNINEQLSKLSCWQDAACIYCGRKYPDTILNIEGNIHHKENLRCIDTKSCNRMKKKILRANKKYLQSITHLNLNKYKWFTIKYRNI